MIIVWCRVPSNSAFYGIRKHSEYVGWNDFFTLKVLRDVKSWFMNIKTHLETFGSQIFENCHGRFSFTKMKHKKVLLLKWHIRLWTILASSKLNFNQFYLTIVVLNIKLYRKKCYNVGFFWNFVHFNPHVYYSIYNTLRSIK